MWHEPSANLLTRSERCDCSVSPLHFRWAGPGWGCWSAEASVQRSTGASVPARMEFVREGWVAAFISSSSRRGLWRLSSDAASGRWLLSCQLSCRQREVSLATPAHTHTPLPSHSFICGTKSLLYVNNKTHVLAIEMFNQVKPDFNVRYTEFFGLQENVKRDEGWCELNIAIWHKKICEIIYKASLIKQTRSSYIPLPLQLSGCMLLESDIVFVLTLKMTDCIAQLWVKGHGYSKVEMRHLKWVVSLHWASCS